MERRGRPTPTGRAVTFGENEVIVSKTDRNGRLTYANEVFLRIAGYDEVEVMGKPHSLIRHPDMPRGVFQLLWETIEQGKEVFAFVKNMTASGDHYWVFAHVTPTFDADGRITGYHSNRRCPDAQALTVVEALYARMREAEARQEDAKSACAASRALLEGVMAQRSMSYPELMFALWEGRL